MSHPRSITHHALPGFYVVMVSRFAGLFEGFREQLDDLGHPKARSGDDHSAARRGNFDPLRVNGLPRSIAWPAGAFELVAALDFLRQARR
jgi:hypothetical protein